MKRPYFNQFDRLMIRADTLQGAIFMLELRCLQLARNVEREFFKLKG